MPLRKDIWRPAIIAAPFEQIVARGSVAGLPCHWLPPMGSFRFLADPFGLWRDGLLHVFVETYDYRVRIGAIEVLSYDADFTLRDRALCLAEPWHLSYPQVFEAEGETWMLPEAHRSGGLTFYRAVDFPRRWEASHRVELDHVPVDATPLWHDGLWWLFYTSASREPDKMASLHISYAERLRGPWRPHPQNPVRVDNASARPGGTIRVIDGVPVLPVQDCSTTYGGAIGALRLPVLTPDRVECELGTRITAPPAFAPYVEGLHTLSAAGDVTLIDVKRTELSAHGLSIEVARHTRQRARKVMAALRG
ncbi:glucosamine inositolphosphorylceramide transferase family protein [Sphingomonas nostoxanthinifaciens]|uniref:glucosamine inositolphosphorylceramide transferase family protein n=1 Tax=Sphingomonas nostoxanthinifaciens TaxID=2872652 RepID=UPI001CC21E10|nr:formyl transferase [Sphingomonas nostoxanthinifaciens]UAK23005.1 formyl transferase [Sphingomonas nostoxanthinifaciens]